VLGVGDDHDGEHAWHVVFESGDALRIL